MSTLDKQGINCHAYRTFPATSKGVMQGKHEGKTTNPLSALEKKMGKNLGRAAWQKRSGK